MKVANEPSRGPLAGVRVLELSSIGPGPHCAMMLSDLGAEVVRIERDGGNGWPNPVMDRGRARLILDLRTEEGQAECAKAASAADVLIEGFRPGVMERLGLGPSELLKANPKLIYGRMTGWGQDGPMAQSAGHDINYIGLTGALAAMGDASSVPRPPLNLIGDFGGGSYLLAFGIVAALYERAQSGLGQVVDAAIVDGVASMMGMFTGLLPSGLISMARDRNLLGGAAPFYRVYKCACGGEMAVGCLESKFFAQCIHLLGLPETFVARQNDREIWPELEAKMATAFLSRTRADWATVFERTDACVTPVISIEEVCAEPQIEARKTYTDDQGVVTPNVVPRFSRSPGAVQNDRDGRDVLNSWYTTTRA